MSKLLLNKPMMLFTKHPFHRNDLANSLNLYMELYSGPTALSPTELSAIETMKDTSGLYNIPNIRTELKKTRSELAVLTPNNTTVANYIAPFPGKASADLVDESVIQMSQRSESLFATGSGTPGILLVEFMGAANTQTRFILVLSVGIEGSGADLILPTNIVAGQRYKVGNIRYKLSNLLGEV